MECVKPCQPLLDALYQHSKSYSNGGSDYSATELLNPPRIVQLGKRYKDFCSIENLSEEDKYDKLVSNISSFIGTAIHSYIEKMLYRVREDADTYRYMLEKRFYEKIEDRYISGQFDIYFPEKSILYDIKTTGAWNMVFSKEDHLTKWEQQMNIYRYLMSCGSRFKEALDVSSGKVVAIYTDWSKATATQSGDYPNSRFEEFNINIWDIAESKNFLEGLIKHHSLYEDVPDDELPECTDNDTWRKPNTWAVYTVDSSGCASKKAKKLFKEDSGETEDDAKKYLATVLGGNGVVVFRPGEYVRCENFCDYKYFCNQYKRICNGK